MSYMVQLEWTLSDGVDHRRVALSNRDGIVYPSLTQDRDAHWMLSLPLDLLSTLLSGSVTQKMESWGCASALVLA